MCLKLVACHRASHRVGVHSWHHHCCCWTRTEKRASISATRTINRQGPRDKKHMSRQRSFCLPVSFSHFSSGPSRKSQVSHRSYFDFESKKEHLCICLKESNRIHFSGTKQNRKVFVCNGLVLCLKPHPYENNLPC